ncbi:MAG: hypothetical protein HYY23_06355 [Verrucomicrobia bacterium]|nr:hypothetical protein [Verrucomicrobiota bacterium]
MHSLSRRDFLAKTAATAGFALPASAQRTEDNKLRLAHFSADVTPPLGHALMGGGIAPATTIDDPLFAHGIVLTSETKPMILVSVDWCEIRNDAFDRWRAVLAEAARTEPARVLVTSVHVHDAPVADLEAERILRQAKASGSICDLEFHERAVQRVAQALRESLSSSQPITHIGLGQAKVEKVASNRRYHRPDGKLTFGRTSSTRDPLAREASEGTIDPWLKTLSFWNRNQPVAALHCYATHPMSHYGRGKVSSDFVGLARQRRQREQPLVKQMYASGCSGNVTAGKYNDGSPENRPVLASRIHQAMVASWESTKRHPLDRLGFRSVALRLEPRNTPGFTVEDLQHRLATDTKPFGQCLAALGLSWRKRAEAKNQIDVPVLDFGVAQLLLLPAEAYVEYQLFAQQLRPDSFVVVMGYGECAPGYIPIEQAWQEGDTNLNDWCWVAPGAEAAMQRALETALKPLRP